MKSLLRRYCILLALLIYWLPNVSAQTLPKVQQIEIKHVGPPAASEELVKANIRVKVGDPYTRTTVDDDVRNLYTTGYFYNIRVSEDQVDGGVKLTYVLQGKLLLTDIRFEGNDKLSTAKLKKKVTSKVGEPLDERKLFSDTQAILKQYQTSGYQKTTVKYTFVNVNEAAGRAAIVFEIVEAPKVKIADINFEGAQAFPEKRLAKAIKTRRRWAFSWITGSGVLKEDQFEDDKEKLAEFYRNEGYIDFEIKDVKFDYVSENKLNINFVLFEGKQYKVGNVSVKGNSLFPTEDLTQKLKMTSGATFTPKGYNKDIEALQDYYTSRGYIDARVIPIKSPNVETGNMDVVYQVEEKDKSFIEKIEIKGNTKTKDKVIRRELAVSPGEVFDMVRVRLSKERLEGTRFFEKVDTQIEDTDVPSRKNLIVGVEESQKTGNFSLGAGFSTVDSVVGFAEVSQGNFDIGNPPYFTGGGQKFRLRVSLGTQRQDYVMSFVEPWFLNRKLAFGVDLYHRELKFQSDLYDEVQTGGKLSLTRALGSDFLIGSVSYTFENVGIKNVDPVLASPELQAEAGNILMSRIGASLAWDTRGGGNLPNRGQRTELLTEFSNGPLGGDKEGQFYKMELRSSRYFKGFFDGHVIELGARLGVVESYGGNPRVPLFYRYFLGGPGSLRGFKYAHVGPRDSFNEPIGGETSWAGSIEYSLPTIERLRLAVFYDIGNVYSDSFSLNPRKDVGEVLYSDNWGVGIRLDIPQLGPLRLDYGFPIQHDSRASGSGRFQFSVGFTRDF
jgi:outer membrane protein insertion porin family